MPSIPSIETCGSHKTFRSQQENSNFCSAVAPNNSSPKNSHKKALRCLIKRNQIEWYRIESSSDRSCSTFRIESKPFVKITLGFFLCGLLVETNFWFQRIPRGRYFVFCKSHAHCSGSGPAINNASSRNAWEVTEVTRVRTKHLLI